MCSLAIRRKEESSSHKTKNGLKNTYKLGPFSSWPAISKDTPNGRDCGGKR